VSFIRRAAQEGQIPRVLQEARLPLGTRVMVENRNNRRRILVRVNDRRPDAPARAIVVSGAAARALGVAPGASAPARLIVMP
jgi:rare lipoprotein A